MQFKAAQRAWAFGIKFGMSRTELARYLHTLSKSEDRRMEKQEMEILSKFGEHWLACSVRNWMREAGQATPDALTTMPAKLAALRQDLVTEEAEELRTALDEYIAALDNGEHPVPPDVVAQVLKEAADLLVVTVGLLHSMGADPLQVVDAVMFNNFKKLEAKQYRDDGKLVTDPATKAKLKREIATDLEDYVRFQPGVLVRFRMGDARYTGRIVHRHRDWPGVNVTHGGSVASIPLYDILETIGE